MVSVNEYGVRNRIFSVLGIKSMRVNVLHFSAKCRSSESECLHANLVQQLQPVMR
jgi:hypothetical protein